ncbi:MAG: copper resistance protein CopC [Ktedonobacteraceae bacterium]|nr:copper resistance protein CopC [Ktedonobacteraceae bacterium]
MRSRRYLRLACMSLLGLSVLLLYTWSPIVIRPPTASAHAFVIGSDPVDGSTVSVAPAVVRIFFNGNLGPASSAQVFASDDRIVNAGQSTISRTNPRELDTPLLPATQLALGGYIVRWTALSSDDGDTTHGVIGFNIGHSSVGLPGEVTLGPSTSNLPQEFTLLGVLAVAWDWLVLLALAFWIGILVTEGFMLERGGRAIDLFSQARKQALPLQWLCLSALLIGEVIALILHSALFAQGLGGGGIDLTVLGQVLSETNYGHLWLLRAGLLVVALAFLWSTTHQQAVRPLAGATPRTRPRTGSFSQLRQQVTQDHPLTPVSSPSKERNTPGEQKAIVPNTAPPLWHTVAWMILAALVLLTFALTSDAAQLAQPHISAIVLEWLYLAAQSIWLGGVAYLAYVLLRLLPVIEPDRHAETLVTVTRRLTPFMLTTLGLFLVSGLFLSESSLSSAQQLVTDPYGRAMLVKFVLVALMLIFSAYALIALCPKISHQVALLHVVDAEMPARRTRQSALGQTERRLRNVLGIQAWMGAGVLLCAALMSFFAPPIVFPAINYAQQQHTSTLPATPAAIQGVQTQKAGNLVVSLQVLPARVNDANTVIVTITDGSGNLVTDAQVQLTINMEIMDMGTARQTIKSGNPVYSATFAKEATFSMFGTWKIVVQVQRPKQAPTQASFEVNLNT